MARLRINFIERKTGDKEAMFSCIRARFPITIKFNTQAIDTINIPCQKTGPPINANPRLIPDPIEFPFSKKPIKKTKKVNAAAPPPAFLEIAIKDGSNANPNASIKAENELIFLLNNKGEKTNKLPAAAGKKRERKLEPLKH